MAYNAEAIGEDGKLIGIAEMAIDIELFCIREGSRLREHQAVGHLVRVNIRLIFIERFEAADEGVKCFRVIFRDIKFNAGSIESKHLCKGRVDSLVDGFGEIHHTLEYQFNIRKETLLEACEERGIRDFGEAAEKSLNSLQRERKGMRRESVGMKNIFWRISAERKLVRG